MAITAVEQERLAAKLAEIRPYLDERQWRLLLGAEARAIGWGSAAAAPPATNQTARKSTRSLMPTPVRGSRPA